jgi:heme exporter protein B
MGKLWWLLWKDAVAEARSLERLGTLGLFAAAVLLTLQFSLAPEAEARPVVAAGFLWATIIFASVLEFRRTFESERRDGTLEGLRSAPLDPVLLFVAKAFSSLVVVGLLATILVPLTALFFVGNLDGAGKAIVVTIGASAGLMAWGTLFAAMSGGARAGEIVLPLLLFPLLVPQTIACVRLLAHFLAGEVLDDTTGALVIIGAFTALSWGTSLLLFEYVLDE